MPTLLPVEVVRAIAPQPLPSCRYAFPDAHLSPTDEPVATGGDFAPETIVEAYRHGIFPWPHPNEEFLWFSPDPRAVIPVDGPHGSRRLERTLRSGRFRATMNAAFPDVVHACAQREEGTWITPGIIEAYCRLHELGWAHSFETWTPDGVLAGGLYGVAVGGLFGAESMFYRIRDGSKAAMVAMMVQARLSGMGLIDVQVLTPHTASMGAVEITRVDYLEQVGVAVSLPVQFTVAR
jgi:leucyl/phenylalanyl-tRNA--protein transferase